MTGRDGLAFGPGPPLLDSKLQTGHRGCQGEDVSGEKCLEL